MLPNIHSFDPELYSAMSSELDRQRNSLELIASENFISIRVMEAMGSWLNNKYSEGYPGRRYYGGNQYIDMIETLAIERAKKLFNAEHANVQPHAGTQANMAAYMALLKPGQKILSIELPQGGHLSHGSPVNFSGMLYSFVFYGLDKETERIDPDNVRKVAEREKPDLILCGYSAYPRQFPFEEFGEIAHELDVPCMADVAHIAGLIAGGVHPNPFPHCDVVTTTTHKTLRGPKGAIILSKERYAQRIDKAVFPGSQGGPFDQMIAAKAVAFKEAMQPSFKEYAKKIVKNAKALAARLMEHGFRLVSGGTDTHLVLVDLRPKHITGREAEIILEKVDISVNRNMIPGDPQKPWITSGIRLGTPALTTRGLKENDMEYIADLINKTIIHRDDNETLSHIKEEVHELCKLHPLYPEIR